MIGTTLQPRAAAQALRASLQASTSKTKICSSRVAMRHYALPSDQGGGRHGHAGPPPPPPGAAPSQSTASIGNVHAGEQAAEVSEGRDRRRRRNVDTSEVGLAAASLLPPLPLYKRILRAHHALPLEMKSLGDSYVKDEFRRHVSIDNPLQIVGFLTQWKVYLDGLEKQQQGQGYRGQQLNVQQFEKLSDEQLYQLHELMTATRELYDPNRAQAQPPGGNQAVHDAVEDALERTHEIQEGRRGGGNRGEGEGQR